MAEVAQCYFKNKLGKASMLSLQVCKSAGLQVCKSAVCICRTPSLLGDGQTLLVTPCKNSFEHRLLAEIKTFVEIVIQAIVRNGFCCEQFALSLCDFIGDCQHCFLLIASSV